MTYRKKLIEVALPLDAINKASAREKSIRHGHPRKRRKNKNASDFSD
jgi:adenine-specific DNA methylase